MGTHKVLEKNTSRTLAAWTAGNEESEGEKRLLDTSPFLPGKGVVELVPTKHGRRRGGFWGKFNSLSWPGESMCRK